MKVFSSSQCRVVYGKVVSDLLNSLNSRSCKKLLLSVFFTFYILKFVLFFGRLSYFFRITGITRNFGNLYPDLKFEVQVPETSKLFQLFLARSSCMMDSINETD